MKKLFCALMALLMLCGVCLAEEMDAQDYGDFTIALPELSQAEYQEKADGAYLFYGAATYFGSPVVLQCQWHEAYQPVTAEEALAALDAETAGQGIAISASRVERDEEMEIGGQTASVRVYVQQIQMQMAFAHFNIDACTGSVVFAHEDGSAHVFTVSASDMEALNAGLELISTVQWK